MMGGWMFGMVWVWLLLILVLALVVAGAIVMFRGGGSSGPRSSQHPAPPAQSGQAEEILRERYARGEITREEYDEMRRALKLGEP
jgi:putative membrane protein